jgi:hypothetical protein
MDSMSNFQRWREETSLNTQMPVNDSQDLENANPNLPERNEFLPPSSQRQRKRKAPAPAADLYEEEQEEDTSRWLDTHVQQLITLRSELEPEFAESQGKQGCNTWFKLQRMMIIACPGFRKSHSACRKKWDAEYKKYKEDKRFLSISGHDRHIQCRFFDQIDRDWANRANVNKVVHSDASGSDNPNPLAAGIAAEPTGDGDPEKLQQAAHREERKEAKKSAAEKLCNYLGEVVEITKTMAKTVEESGKVFEKLDSHMEDLNKKL